MDAVNYDRVKYEETRQALMAKLKPMGYPVDKIPFIPYSAYNGDNIKVKSDKTPWYSGPTLLEALDQLVEPKKPTEKPLRLPIQEVFTITGQGTVPVGSVVGPTNTPPTVVEEFTAQIVVLNHPTAIGKNYTPVFHLHTAQLACTITEIVEKKDPKTGLTAQKNPDFIKTGDVAIVKIKPTRPVCAEKHSEFPALGRFAIRDMGQTVAAGIILDLVPRKA